MEFPVIWFAFSAVVGVVFWAFLLWLAWLLVSSIKGMHTELTRIRELLNDVAARSSPWRVGRRARFGEEGRRAGD